MFFALTAGSGKEVRQVPDHTVNSKGAGVSQNGVV